MRILSYKWKAYNQRDIVEAFRSLGHEVDEITGEMASFDCDPDFEERFRDELKVGNYDLVFTVNYFPLISDVCQAMGIKYAAWTCDSPLSAMYHESVFNENNRVFSFDKYTQILFEDMGAKMEYLPLGAAIARADAVCGGENGTYRHDISFVGSAYRKNSYDEICDKLPDYVRGYFDALIRMQSGVYDRNYIDEMLSADIVYELNKHFNIEKSPRSFSDLSLIFSTTVLGFKIARTERMKLIGNLSKRFDVDVYTEEADAEFGLARNLGPADYWKETPKIFRESKINLNFTIKNIKSGIPLRVWDILGAGGFCMTNFQPELPLYFENGKDLVWFTDEQDLLKKCEYYLAHEDERRAIAARGYEKVKEYHNLTDRVEQLLSICSR